MKTGTWWVAVSRQARKNGEEPLDGCAGTQQKLSRCRSSVGVVAPELGPLRMTPVHLDVVAPKVQVDHR